ncbi:hypothetical protein PC121_g22725, partial [Phytophthora cactorum]
PEYVTSLMQHNKEFLPVAKKKLPQSSRCALISVPRIRFRRLVHGGNLILIPNRLQKLRRSGPVLL